jgi:hypothetical protein
MASKRTPLQSIPKIEQDHATGSYTGGLFAGRAIAQLYLKELKANGDQDAIVFSLLGILSPSHRGQRHANSARTLQGQLHGFLHTITSSIAAQKGTDQCSDSVKDLLRQVGAGLAMDEMAYLNKMEHVELLHAA